VAEAAAAAAMIAGHFGFAALVKGREPATPLWALMLASVWLDIVFVPLFLLGIETLAPVDAAHSGYGANIIHANYTHSVVGVVALSVILGGVGTLRWGRRSGLVIGLVSASHWALDLIVHRADMPIMPGDFGHLPKLGFGLWRLPLASMVVEGGLVLLGAWVYWRAAHAVTAAAGRGGRTAAVAAALIAVFGLFILWLDVRG
jgi:hypothetical protein